MPFDLLLTHPWRVETWIPEIYFNGSAPASFLRVCDFLGLSIPQCLNLLSLWPGEAVSLGLRDPYFVICGWKDSLDPKALDCFLDIHRARCRLVTEELGNLEDELEDRYQWP